jgi:methionyl-tRNA formyltransferase
MSNAPAPLRLVFMGTPDLAATCLRALLAWPGCSVLAAVSQPDKPSGRDLKLQPTAVKLAAESAGIPVLQPKKARDPEFLEQLRVLTPDLIVVAAFGQLLPQALLNIPKFGCVNVHTSLLPRHRGAAPIQWAIAEGDAETGVTLMKMDAGLDTGPMIVCAKTAITAEDTGQTLHDRLAELGGTLLVEKLPDYVAGRIEPVPQPAESATHARKITKDDGRIDWSLSATTIWNRIRAFTPWPGAFSRLPGATERSLVKLFDTAPEAATGEAGSVLEAGSNGLLVACGEGSLRIREVQREAGKRMGAGEFLRGFPIERGARLG